MNFFFRLADALKVMIRSGRGFSSVLKKGASVASTQVLHNCRHYIPTLNTVVDVGANKGQFTLAALHFYPQAQVYSFEPVPDTFALLQQHTRGVSQVHAYNFALGSMSGELEFFSNTYSHASSALPVSELQQHLVPQTASTHRIQVPVKRLDDLNGALPLVSPVLLKLDVQGYEKEVLKGAANRLRQIDYLLFETSFVHMYEGEPLFDEMHHFVKELGFEFIAPVGFLQSDKLQILQMDLLYKRKHTHTNGNSYSSSHLIKT
ncbi:FkbM family methyltransferase [Chitinophaga pendula]|uniref:FkbM family methyltransferase n=1 Tax=Chitinophaga TaxID=79328 RepID=UPI000BAE9861|nr:MULTISPECIES: FkbM family methyltransferase [Chitinophaga]ASZ14201.1 hypothetical protein CK934_26240 [Chitinophaga sp. MD30]UCJ08162.1 FkbM family methyltransferase [Chitinophaga pendula]